MVEREGEERKKGFVISEAHDEIKKLCKFHEIDISNYKGKQRKNKIARNLVDYEVGKQIQFQDKIYEVDAIDNISVVLKNEDGKLVVPIKDIVETQIKILD